jgi:hypothetical protein
MLEELRMLVADVDCGSLARSEMQDSGSTTRKSGSNVEERQFERSAQTAYTERS